ncbi:MAG: sulfatase/phosphatase domain-containing protein, partial [Planctomycetota bacterium]
HEGGVRVPAFFSWPGRLTPAVVNEPLHHVDIMPTLLALVGGSGDPDKPFDGKNALPTLESGKPSPHEDILINVELFRGAIRKGNWKLIQIALLPGSIELYDVGNDPGETRSVATEHPEIVADLKARLLAYAQQQKMSEWLKCQVDYLGFQGKTVLTPESTIDDGLPTEIPVLPPR